MGAWVISESVVWSDWDAAIKHKVDLSSFTPFLGSDLVGLLALTLGQDMEVWVHLLVLVFVVVESKLVVVRCVILPTLGWLNVKNSHELVNLRC